MANRIPKHRGKMKIFARLKTIPVIALLGLFIAFGSSSCAIRSFISSLPLPTVLQEEQYPHKVAILPFVNKSSTPEGGETVRKMFYNFFSSLNYRDLEPFVIDQNLKANHLYAAVAGGKNVSPQKLGQLLGVDAVIYGEVISLGKIYALVYSDSQAGLKARMVRCSNAKPVWELEHTIHIEDLNRGGSERSRKR